MIKLLLSPRDYLFLKEDMIGSLLRKGFPKFFAEACFYLFFLLIIFIFPFGYCIDKLSVFCLESDKYQYNFVIVAIAKNEGEYIEEWVDYHKTIGVDHIIIYNNESTDDMLQKLKPYVEDGYVEVIDIYGQAMQVKAYNNAIKHNKTRCKYIAFIDCDEFLCFLDSDRNPLDVVEKLFEKQNVAAVGVNWQLFGSSGHLKKPSGLLRDNYKMAGNANRERNSLVKIIVRPERCHSLFYGPHCIFVKKGFIEINANGERAFGAIQPINEYKNIKLAHYFTKSLEEYKRRRSTPSADAAYFYADSWFSRCDYADYLCNDVVNCYNACKTRQDQ